MKHCVECGGLCQTCSEPINYIIGSTKIEVDGVQHEKCDSCGLRYFKPGTADLIQKKAKEIFLQKYNKAPWALKDEDQITVAEHNRILLGIIKERDAYISHYRELASKGICTKLKTNHECDSSCSWDKEGDCFKYCDATIEIVDDFWWDGK